MTSREALLSSRNTQLLACSASSVLFLFYVPFCGSTRSPATGKAIFCSFSPGCCEVGNQELRASTQQRQQTAAPLRGSPCTSGRRILAVLLVLLSVCALLRVLHTQLVTDLKGLAHGANDAHGLTLENQRKQREKLAYCLSKVCITLTLSSSSSPCYFLLIIFLGNISFLVVKLLYSRKVTFIFMSDEISTALCLSGIFSSE